MIGFKIGHIQICFHFTFFAIIALLMLLEDTRYTIYGLYACILHELGHLFVMQLLGVKTSRILFYAAGIKINFLHQSILPFWKDLLILSGGCFINFFTFGLFMFLSKTNEELLVFAVINLIIGIFNLLPVRGFDGEKISDLLIEQHLPIEKIVLAKRVMHIVCIGVIFILLFFFWFNHNRNISLYFTLLYFLFSSMLF